MLLTFDGRTIVAVERPRYRIKPGSVVKEPLIPPDNQKVGSPNMIDRHTIGQRTFCIPIRATRSDLTYRVLDFGLIAFLAV